MKKIISLLLTAIVLMTVLIGCTQEKVGQKTEEEIKEQLKSDLEIETANMKDMDALYDFVKANVLDVTRENFDAWQAEYYDITGDGTDEVIFIDSYRKDWNDKVEIISGDTGEYKTVDSEIYLAKYDNDLAFEDGFIVLTAMAGGSGIKDETLSLYKYNGVSVIPVIEHLTTYYMFSGPEKEIEEIGTIEGSFKEFTYTLVHKDNRSNKEDVVVKIKYTYDEANLGFTMETILDKQDYSEIDSSTNFIKDYSIDVRDGSLIVKYDNKENVLVKGNGISEIIKDDGNGEFILKEKLYVLEASKQKDRVYFSSVGPDYSASTPVYYYVDVVNHEIHWIDSTKEHTFVENVEVERISGFDTETIRGTKLQYDKYSAVIIPWYPKDSVNFSKLEEVSFIHDKDGIILDFAVFGKMQDIEIKLFEGIGDSGTVIKEIETLEDTILNISSSLPTDMSYYEITGKVHTGEGYYEDVMFTLDDMRDSIDYEVYTIK